MSYSIEFYPPSLSMKNRIDEVLPLVESIQKLERGNSLKLGLSFSEKVVSDVCNQMSNSEKAYVYLKYDDSYEVCFLPKGLPRGLFKKEKIEDDSQQLSDDVYEEAVMNAAREFLTRPFDELKGYVGNIPNVQEFILNNLVLTNFVTMRCNRLAIFKKKGNVTGNIKATIKRLAEKGVIKFEDKIDTKERFGNAPSLFKIL